MDTLLRTLRIRQHESSGQVSRTVKIVLTMAHADNTCCLDGASETGQRHDWQATKTRYHSEASSSTQMAEMQDTFFSLICQHSGWPSSIYFQIKTYMPRTQESLQCCPPVLLKLEVWIHLQVTLMIAFPAVSTDSNLSLHPFDYTLVCHTQQLHLHPQP